MKQGWRWWMLAWVLLSFSFPATVQGFSKIIINLPSRTLAYYEDGALVKEYLVAIGKPSTPTPVGEFQIQEKIINPVWYPPDKKGWAVLSGPANPLGYRWMGIGGNYGIHGTNMPWSIGSVVSNGCIRMFEEQAEELFDKVAIHTPVYIVYERLKIHMDDKGYLWAGLFPDVYGYQYVGEEDIQNHLQSMGTEALVPQERVRELLHGEEGKTVLLGRLRKIQVNGQLLAETAIAVAQMEYVPVLAVAAALRSPVVWDVQQFLIKGKTGQASGLVKEGVIYVKAGDLPLLFGGTALWSEKEECIQVSVPCLWLGKALCGAVQRMEGRCLAPVREAIRQADAKYSWREGEKALWLGMRRVPVLLLEGEPYLEAEKLGMYLHRGILWQEQEQRLVLSENTFPMDYSMYLEEMGSFFD